MAVAVAMLAALAAAGPASAQQPAVLPPQMISASGSGVVSLGGIAVARDGTGGIDYLAQSGGGQHVFVSRLSGGRFGPPEQLDAGLTGSSSQPVIAAGNGGVLQCAFINAGELYVVAASGAAPWSAPQPLFAGAQNPSISMSNFGKAYLAFTAAGDGGQDVRVEYFDTHVWAPAPSPLNVSPGDDAGTGAGRPAVAAAGDGVGIVAWGEGGHLYARRVWGTQTSVAAGQLDPQSVGGTAVSAVGLPQVGVGGNSSYVDIAFQVTLGSGAAAQTRDLLARLVAEDTFPGVPFDGIGALSGTQPSDSAGAPAISMNEYGRGYAAAADVTSGQVLATALGSDGAAGPPATAGSGPPGADSHPTPAPAGLVSNLLAWMGGTSSDNAEVLARYAPGGGDLGPPILLSDPSAGQVQAGTGLAAGGDGEGDAAVAWVQGSSGALAVEAAQMLQPPGQAAPSVRFTYVRAPQPVLSWNAAREQWGPLSYTVTLDGATIGQTTGTSITAPAGLTDGPHVWQVSATNAAGQTSQGPAATVFIDTSPPQLRVRFSGRLRARRPITLHLFAQDAPAPQAGAQASGIATVTVRWGDGTAAVGSARLSRARHAYRRPGIYRLLVRVSDRAGNVTTISRYLRILR